MTLYDMSYDAILKNIGAAVKCFLVRNNKSAKKSKAPLL